MNIGPYKVSQLVVDHFRLDGGAMFGSVPKALWSRRIPADAENRIQLASRILVIEGDGRKILVDVGCGTKGDEKHQKIYDLKQLRSKPLHEAVPGVTDVVLTHLHFDHAGGVSYRTASGELALSYPKARHFLQQENFERGKNPGVRERGSYLQDSVTPLEQANLELVQGEKEILPEIRVFAVNGHTKGLQCVQIGKGPGALVYVADLIPTAHHIAIPYVMGYDLCAETSMREKEALLAKAVEADWWIVFEHDAETCMVKVRRDPKSGFAAAESAQLPSYTE